MSLAKVSDFSLHAAASSGLPSSLGHQGEAAGVHDEERVDVRRLESL